VFRNNRSGSVGLIFGMALPALMAAVGVAVDISHLTLENSKLQAVADLTALATARELRLANASAGTLQSVAERFALANLVVGGVQPPVTVRSDMLPNKTGIRVQIEKQVRLYVLGYIAGDFMTTRANATAKLAGGNPVCLLALDQKEDNTLVLTENAQLNAPNCAIYSNSKDPKGLMLQLNSSIHAAAVYSAGGKYANAGAITPAPQLDAPAVADPLANRPPPTVPASCDHQNTTVSVSQTIFPGVYCGGLYVTGGARVVLNPGVYILTNGPLMVDGSSTLFSTGAGFYLTGKDSTFYFASDSNIDLTAPTDGPLAGLLISQNRDVSMQPPGIPYPPGVKPPVKFPPIPKLAAGIPKFKDPVNQILSNNARTLLGTIYTPQGALYIEATNPIADQSAYTIIVARQLGLAAGPNLILNTNYGATSVPVPNGLGVNGAARLTQ
jgi:hypothetical protein